MPAIPTARQWSFISTLPTPDGAGSCSLLSARRTCTHDSAVGVEREPDERGCSTTASTTTRPAFRQQQLLSRARRHRALHRGPIAHPDGHLLLGDAVRSTNNAPLYR